MAKSELILAFNEIAETRKLPKEVIIEALKAALVSAYRRNENVSSAQRVEAHVDERTGEPSVWVEKEVVEEVQSRQTEVSLEEARKYDPNVQLGDTIMVEDTPEGFGRIAAQTAKQVILQRMREAEREAQYEEYQDRVGDLVTGTVQSDNGDVVTVGLGRTEAILPRSQQQPGERYRMHDKVRAYVMEVRRTNRGPQIVLSRTHRNMLRRLLEYEVPEIYNGTVEIKSIAREPGARSKVAVAALQPGADPVGACVGMRGVRIQSIVKELNGEKIDVIEWSPDQAEFISKALSPARVSAVFLDDDPEAGRTATVVVPDDQLSLAIGREGQNARLAAKLTGWRIDIKSVSEAAVDAFKHIREDAELAPLAEKNAELVEKIEYILGKKAENRPVMPEEYVMLTDFVKLVETRRTELLEESRVEVRERMHEARAQVPPQAYEHPLEETDLPLRVYNVLEEAGYNNVGEVMEQYFYDPNRLLNLPGIGQAGLEDIRNMIETIEFVKAAPEAEAEAAEAEAEAEPVEAAEAEVPEAAEPVAEEAPVVEEPETVAPQPVADVVEQTEEDYERARRRRLIEQLKMQEGTEAQVAALEAEEKAADEKAARAAEAACAEAEARAEAKAEEKVEEPAAEVDELAFDVQDDYFEDEEEDEETVRRRAKQRRRQLVFDEEAGRMVAKRRRKGGRKRGKWEDFDALDDLDEFEDL